MRFLFVDRIVESIPGQVIRGVKHITQDDYYLSCDEQGRAYFCSSLIGETLGQLAAWNVMAQCDFKYRPVAGVVAEATSHRKAYVGETLLLESFIDCLDESAVQYHSVASINGDVVFTIDGALGPMLPMSDFIHEEDVRQQYQEIDRPGDWAVIKSSITAMDTPALTSAKACPSTQFDRIVSHVPNVSITAEKKLTRTAPYFPDHFPKKPVLPLTILLECTINLAQTFLGSTSAYQKMALRKIKMSDFVSPGDILTSTMTIKRQTSDELILSCRSDVLGKRVCVLEMVLTSKGNEHE